MNIIAGITKFIRRKFGLLPVGIPGPDGRDRIAKPPEEYVELLHGFADEVANCMHVSREFGGISSPTGKHFYASVLFTGLVTRATTLVFTAPYSPWSKREFEHWDYASVANITRTIMETRLAFFYLCIDDCHENEWDCRWNLFNLHDCVSRVNLMDVMGHAVDKAGLLKQADELRKRLSGNSFFQKLPAKRKRELLKGGKAYLKPLEDIALDTGMELRTFKMLWRLMSSHVHSLPFSFYRVGENERGTGVQTVVEENYTSLMLTFALTLLVGARDEFRELMGTKIPQE